MGDYRNRAHQIFGDDLEKLAYQERVCDNTFNSILRNICKECGISEEMTLYKRGATVTAPKYTFVSSHTGRRTCATLLYLHGCDIYTISRILAHSGVDVTAQKYVLCPIRQLSEETMAYFSQFV
jgi:integrase